MIDIVKILPLFVLPTSGPLPRVVAYLDPGTGSYVIQLLVAGLLGGIFILKTQWSKIKAFVTKLATRRNVDGH